MTNFDGKSSFSSEFCDVLEYRLSKEFANSEQNQFKHLWCDGISPSTISSELEKRGVIDSRRLITKGWIGKDGQGEFEVIVHLGDSALERSLVKNH